jgi:hypothetical protein
MRRIVARFESLRKRYSRPQSGIACALYGCDTLDSRSEASLVCDYSHVLKLERIHVRDLV